MSKFEHYCWVWNYKNSYFINKFSKNDNYMLIKLEDLISDNFEEFWYKIFEFLNLSKPDNLKKKMIAEKANPSKQIYFNKWNKWDNRTAELLDKHCGNLMQKLGYGDEIAWKKKISS